MNFTRRLTSEAMLVLTMAMPLAGCVDTESLAGSASAQSTFIGCTSAVGMTNTSIRINFEFPTDATKVVVYRDGIEIGSSSTRSSLFIFDNGLLEGVTYNYTCDAFTGAVKKVGERSIAATPINSNAPLFTGIFALEVATSHTANVTWRPESASGPRVAFYKIFANVGTTVDWSKDARKVVAADGTFTDVLSGLGDELSYAVGVRACTTQGLCDSNTASLTVTLPDGGAPQTTGVTNVTVSNFRATLIAPWSDSQGGISSRRIFMCTGAGCSFSSSPEKIYDLTGNSLFDPPQSLTVENILENTTYRFKVVDVDPSGHESSNHNVVAITTGDLTPPFFSGINSIALGSPSDSTLIFSFIALARQGTVDANAINGATDYLLYATSAAFPAMPTNACQIVAPKAVIAAGPFPPGPASHELTGQTARTNYSFCLRARDAAGNISANNSPVTVTTGDVTPPAFNGLQSFTFDATTKKLQLVWNPSTSTDIRQYKIKLWKNTTTPAPTDTTILLADKTAGTSRNLSQSDYPLSNHDVVYALVDACDNAGDLGLGQPDNCTAKSTFKSVTIPIILPPANFSGIKALTNADSLSEGQVTVRWNEPTPWSSDYQGFRVYGVNTTTNEISLMRTCACSTPGSCTTADTQCTVTGLIPAKTYRFHVRGYDSVGNETDYLSPTTSYADVKVKDTTPPVFVSGLTVDKVTLAWSRASDNQANGEGNAITYQVYRKANSNFSNAMDPSTDGTRIATLSGISYTDTYSSGGTYFYTICAVDSGGNRTCDGAVRSVIVSDFAVPVIASFTTNKTSTTDPSNLLKRWNLSWSVSDDHSASANLRVRIYQKISSVETAVATTSDTLIYDSLGGSGTLTGLKGPANQNTYISYLLWAQDEAGNEAVPMTLATGSIDSRNIMTVTSVTKPSGPLGGGRTLIIKGSNFTSGLENGFGASSGIKIGTTNCLSVTYVSSDYLTCITPPQPAGIYDITISNPDGSSLTAPALYTYEGASTDICENASARVASPFAAGNGSSANPFILCTASHLTSLYNYAVSSGVFGGGYAFKLGDNIDLSDVTDGFTFGARSFLGTLDGGGLALVNNHINLTSPNVGFLTLQPNDEISNLQLLGFSLTSTSTATAWRLTIFNQPGGSTHFASPVTLDNIVVRATFKGNTASAGAYNYLGLMARTGFVDLIGKNLDIDIEARGRGEVGAIAGNSQYLVSVRDSKIRLTVDAVEQGTATSYVGGVVGIGQNVSVIRSSVVTHLRNTASIASEAYIAGGIAGQIFDVFTADQNRVHFRFPAANAGTAVGTVFGRTLASSCTSSLSITDSILLGNIDSSAPRSMIGASFISCNASSSINIARLLSSVTYGSVSGNRYATGVFTFNGATPPSGSDVFYNNSTSITTPTSANVPAMAYNTADLQNNDVGNLYSQAGFDFASGFAKWQWCPTAPDYPRLKWERCP